MVNLNIHNHHEINLIFVLFSLAEIFQDDSIPDPEQELDLELLGLKLDLVCNKNFEIKIYMNIFRSA